MQVCSVRSDLADSWLVQVLVLVLGTLALAKMMCNNNNNKPEPAHKRGIISNSLSIIMCSSHGHR